MGLWDAVGDVVDDAKTFLGKIPGLGEVTKGGPDLSETTSFIFGAAGVDIATSPPLVAAQVEIGGMKLSTGFGAPDTAEGLNSSVTDLEDAGNILVGADPAGDRWDGSASQAYAGKNSEHRHQVFEVADADKQLHSQIKAQADHVASTRKSLQAKIKFLADWDTVTAWMNRVPGGAAAKLVMDTGVAAEQIAEATATTTKLAWETTHRAGKVNALLSKYQGAADETVLPDTSCEPFGAERRGGTLPSRTNPETPYTVPDPGAPLPTPPAAPYGDSGPVPVPAPAG